MNKYFWIGMVLGSTALVQAAEDAHAGHAAGESGKVQGKKLALEILTAEGGPVDRLVVFPAEIKLNRDRTAAVSPHYAGVIRSMQVKPGDAVKKGDTLAVVENRETLAAYNLTAPLDGLIISKTRSTGESAAEDAVLFEIADLSSVWAEINIFPQYGSAVHAGDRVELLAPSGESVAAAIQYVSPLVSPETRTLQARCVVSHPELKPGMFIRARIAVETVQAAVRVEKEAVQTLNGRTVVFIQDADGLEPREVNTGVEGAQAVEIRTGLKAGEKYVGHGAFDLKAEQVTGGLDGHAGHGH